MILLADVWFFSVWRCWGRKSLWQQHFETEFVSFCLFWVLLFSACETDFPLSCSRNCSRHRFIFYAANVIKPSAVQTNGLNALSWCSRAESGSRRFSSRVSGVRSAYFLGASAPRRSAGGELQVCLWEDATLLLSLLRPHRAADSPRLSEPCCMIHALQASRVPHTVTALGCILTTQFTFQTSDLHISQTCSFISHLAVNCKQHRAAKIQHHIFQIHHSTAALHDIKYTRFITADSYKPVSKKCSDTVQNVNKNKCNSVQII